MSYERGTPVGGVVLDRRTGGGMPGKKPTPLLHSNTARERGERESTGHEPFEQGCRALLNLTGVPFHSSPGRIMSRSGNLGHNFVDNSLLECIQAKSEGSLVRLSSRVAR